MDTVYIRTELTDDEIACLRTAPHKIHAATNVAYGTPCYPIAALSRLGLLYPARRFVGRDCWSDATEYDLTPEGLKAIGGVRPTAADNEVIACVWPTPAPLLPDAAEAIPSRVVRPNLLQRLVGIVKAAIR